MPLAFSFTVTQDLVTPRAHGQIMRRVNRGVLERWRDKYLPLHFVGGATNRYGYARRGLRYSNWKRKKYGHTVPLVLTGKLRDTIREKVKITATQHGARLRSRGYFPMKNEMRSEIERITEAERGELARWATDEYVRLASTPEFKRKRRRGTGRG